MWTDEQLDQAEYVAYADAETKQLLNVGTIEIQGTGYQGPYICTPMPPFGSLKNGGGTGSLPFGLGVRVPGKRYSVVAHPGAFPSPHYGEKMVVHQYGDGSV
jgi:hypothetical protein